MNMKETRSYTFIGLLTYLYIYEINISFFFCSLEHIIYNVCVSQLYILQLQMQY